MSYIGNQPATAFETVQKQISTSNSGTTITLDRAVTSVQDILVTIDAVVQSYDNYSVSGTTLTVGGTLSNNRVEILYVGRTMQSVDPTDDSVSAAKIKTDAVTTAKVENDAITVDKLNLISTSSVPSIEAKGDGSVEGKITWNCENNSHGQTIQASPHSSGQSWTLKLPDNSPTADKFLKVKSITGSGSTATGQLEFADAPSGGLQHINTISITSSTASATFLHGTNNVVLNDGTYENFLIIGSGIQLTNDDDQIRVSFSVDNGSNYNAQTYRATDQVEMNQSQNSGSASADGQSVSGASAIGGAVGNNLGNGFMFTMFLFNLNSTVVQKTALVEALEQQHNLIYKKRSSFITIAEYNQAIDGIRFNCNSGTFSKATFRLYGITNG